MTDSDPGNNSRPTSHVRYWVIVALCLAAAVSYIARNSISVAEEDVRLELGMSIWSMGWVMSAFFITYAVFQIPAGRVADVWGSRKALTVFAVLWSVSSVFMGLAMGFWSLFMARLLMGAAQAGLFPGSVISIRHWLPPERRALACGFLASSMSAGGAIASVLTGVFLNDARWNWHWRWVFILFCLPGLVWAMWFYRWFRNRPEEHPRVDPDEIEAIRGPLGSSKAEDASSVKTPWGLLLSSPRLWLICAQQFFRAAGYIFYATWFPTFLKKTEGVSTEESGLLTSLPLLAVVVGSPLGGALVDWIWKRTRSRRLSRQLVATSGLLLASLLVLAATFATSTTAVLTLITASSFSFAVGGPCSYLVTIDMGGKHLASVFSTMNMSGNIAAVICPLAVPLIVESTGDWNNALFLVAGIYLAAALCWAFLNPEGTLVDTASSDEESSS